MALKALTADATVEFVSPRDPDYIKKQVALDPKDASKGTKEQIVFGKDASVFRLRSLDVFLMGHIYDNATGISGRSGSDEVGIQTRLNQTNIDTVRFGLCSIPDNFLDANGNKVPLEVEKAFVNGREYTAVAEKVLNSLGLGLIQEMAGKIKEISDVALADEKN